MKNMVILITIILLGISNMLISAGNIISDAGNSSGITYYVHSVEGYIPANTALIKDAGMEILPIPSDTIGLRTGLEVDVDILGNPVTGPPDLGAIEVNRDHF